MLTWIRNTLFLAVASRSCRCSPGRSPPTASRGCASAVATCCSSLYIGTIAVPWQSYMIPQFILLSNLKLSNTLWAIILLQAFGAFGVFLMKQFYETIPEDLSRGRPNRRAQRVRDLAAHHAAAVGARDRQPQPADVRQHLERLPGAADLPAQPRPVDDAARAQELRPTTSTTPNYALLFAGLTISVLPIAIIFLLGQRYFVEGIATSGMKG